MELSTLLVRRAAVAAAQAQARCGACGRTPLAGELLHVFDSGRRLCALCLRAVPDDGPRPVRAERLRARERAPAAARRAA